METPELDKITLSRENIQVIGEFLEWLTSFANETNYRLSAMEWDATIYDLTEGEINRLIHAFCGADYHKAEAERRAILKQFQTS